MRWDRLFADLEIQLVAEERRERDAEVAERTRAERARVSVGERLVGALGCELAVRTRGGAVTTGRLLDCGDGWLLLGDAARSALVAAPSVIAIHGLPARPRDDTRARRFGIGYALRTISRDRRAVVVGDVDGGGVHGTIDVVGADALDLAEHPLDTPRRTSVVTGVRTIPFAAIAVVSSTG